MLDARNISEWTGRPLQQHRDQDVVRWGIARLEARACIDRLVTQAPRAIVAPQRVGNREVMRASSKVAGSFNALFAASKGRR